MKIIQPKTVTLTHRADLPGYFSSMADGAPYIAATVRAGGWLNQPYQAAIEAARLQMRVAADAAGDDATKRDAALEAFGRDIIEALFDHCVTSWETSLIDGDTGKRAEPTRENFIDLSKSDIPQIADWVRGLEKAVKDIASFIAKEDEALEKN